MNLPDKQVCQKGLEDVLNYLENENGEVAVFDATNTTKKRRRTLYNTIVVEKGFKLFFVESICNDQSIIESNIRQVKVTSPDYVTFKVKLKHMIAVRMVSRLLYRGQSYKTFYTLGQIYKLDLKLDNLL